MKAWMNEWMSVEYPGAYRKIVATQCFPSWRWWHLLPPPLAPTALDLFWNTFKKHILEIPESLQTQISHVTGLQKSHLVLVTFYHVWYHFLPLFFIPVNRKQPPVTGKNQNKTKPKTKTKTSLCSNQTEKAKERREILIGTFIPFSGSWLWTILVVLTLNLKPQRPQGSQEGRALGTHSSWAVQGSDFVSNLLLY